MNNETASKGISFSSGHGEAGASRWLALTVVCLGVLMIMVDSTIVNVALPSIKTDLGFSEASLAWVVNAYFLTYGGFLLLGGRLGDLFGHRLLFLLGLGAFSAASLACSLAGAPIVLVAARAIQGVGGAIVTAVAMSLIMNLFGESSGRAKAMGAYGFVCAGGSSLGAILGGTLTSRFGWPSIFIINLPIGAMVIALSLRLLPKTRQKPASQSLDVWGAITGTAALILAVYVIVNSNETGLSSYRPLGLLVVAIALLAAFLMIEMRVKQPLMPLRLFKVHNVTVANIVVVLWAAALFAWFFLSALYLQLVGGLDPFQVGLAFVPTNLIMAVFSLGISGGLVSRFGIRWPLVAGLLLAAGGLFLLSRAPVGGAFTIDVLPGMLLFGIGAGIAINPMLLAATNGVATSDAGLASGIVNTSFAMGGALWLAVITCLAARYTAHLQATGTPPLAALNGGYNLAFLVAACLAAGAAVCGGALLRLRPTTS